MLTQERLKELYQYDPNTGYFTRIKTGSGATKGKITDGEDKEGYTRVTIDGTTYRAHRLASLYMLGQFPADGTDHINGVRDDNRWVNLRDADSLINSKNTKIRSDNKSGIVGVGWRNDTNRWRCEITVNKRRIGLGYYYDLFDACCARKSAELTFGFHANHGRRA